MLTYTNNTCVLVPLPNELKPCKTNADCSTGTACDISPNGDQTFTCIRDINQACLNFSTCANGLQCSLTFFSCYCVN